MHILIPAAGLSTRFPNMRPKYSLTDYTGKMMFERSIAPFIGKHKITIGLIKENEDRYPIRDYIEEEYPNLIDVVMLENRTGGPADTVYQMLNQMRINSTEEIFIKDCDSFFEHTYQEGNYVCVSSIKEHKVLNRLGEKSFVQLNNQGIIIGIIEKQVVSDKFCVGGYKFESAQVFIDAFEQLQADNIKEIFVSNIIEQCLQNKLIFKESSVSEYYDVGTANEWFEFNDKATIFCDIDGTIIKAQSRREMKATPVPIIKNIARLKEMIDNGSVIIFTTARPHAMYSQIEDMLRKLGFSNFQLITGLPNTKRVLINDYNEANPYPRAIAVNIKRDNDNLSDFI